MLRHTLKANADTANSPLVRLAMGSVDKYGQGIVSKPKQRHSISPPLRTYLVFAYQYDREVRTAPSPGVCVCLRKVASALEARRSAARISTV